MREKTNRTGGFTVFEFIIAIGVILCIILLLAPVIGKVTRSATRKACLGNLRALHQGLVQYRDSNKGAYPYSKSGTEASIKKIEDYVGNFESLVRCPAVKTAGSYSYDPNHTDSDDDAIVLGDSAGYEESIDGLGVSTNHDGLGGFYLRANGTIEYILGMVYRRRIKYHKKIKLVDAIFYRDPVLRGDDSCLVPIDL